MSLQERMETFIRETAELRRELIQDGDEVTAMVYALAAAYIAEYAAQEDGWETVTTRLGQAANMIRAAAEMNKLDDFLGEVLNG